MLRTPLSTLIFLCLSIGLTGQVASNTEHDFNIEQDVELILLERNAKQANEIKLSDVLYLFQRIENLENDLDNVNRKLEESFQNQLLLLKLLIEKDQLAETNDDGLFKDRQHGQSKKHQVKGANK